MSSGFEQFEVLSPDSPAMVEQLIREAHNDIFVTHPSVPLTIVAIAHDNIVPVRPVPRRVFFFPTRIEEYGPHTVFVGTTLEDATMTVEIHADRVLAVIVSSTSTP